MAAEIVRALPSTWRPAPGYHDPEGPEMSVIEAVTWLRNEAWTWRPRHLGQILRHYAQGLNDAPGGEGEALRTELTPYAARLALLPDVTPDQEERMAALILRWMAVDQGPLLLRLAGFTSQAHALERAALMGDLRAPFQQERALSALFAAFHAVTDALEVHLIEDAKPLIHPVYAASGWFAADAAMSYALDDLRVDLNYPAYYTLYLTGLNVARLVSFNTEFSEHAMRAGASLRHNAISLLARLMRCAQLSVVSVSDFGSGDGASVAALRP